MKNPTAVSAFGKLLSIVALLGSALLAYSAEPSDIPFEQRVRQAETIVRGLRADGNGRDWAGYPGRFSASGNVADAARDLTSSRVLADAQGIHVCVGTRVAPSREDSAFGFKLDFIDTQADDVDFCETAGGQCPTISYKSGKRPIAGVQVGTGDCVEWYVPWDALAKALPEINRDAIDGTNSRSWIRVIPYSMNQQHQVVDQGAAAACFRLPIKLNDDVTPGVASESKEIPDMVTGQIYVLNGGMQGSHGIGGHRNTWCYDLTGMTPQHQLSPGVGGPDNAQYPVFGRKLITPVSGRIGQARDDVKDHAAWINTKGLPSNYASLDFDGYRLWYYHIKHNSLVVKQGGYALAGEPIAAIGNTGPSTSPHLHVALQHGPSDATDLIPIMLTGVKVSLNGGGGDFWARKMPKWAVQEGFFFEPSAPTPATRPGNP